MKKILTLMVVASLLVTPGLAWAGPEDDPNKPKKIDFDAAVKAAAEKIVEADGDGTVLSTTAPQNDVSQGKLWAGIGMAVLGAGIIYKGVDLYESDPDPFGRKKNADSYLAVGIGSVITFFGVMAIRGGLAGRGFND